MGLGIILCTVIGFFSTVYPISQSKGAKTRVNTYDYGFWSNIFATIFIFISMIVKASLTGGISVILETDFLQLTPIMLIAALLASLNSVFSINAMKIGHAGLTNAFSQSAMAFNFILMVIIFNAPATFFNFIAIGVTFIGIFLMGMNSDQVYFNKKWLFLCLASFIVNGLYQTVSSIPSQVGYVDNINYRGFIFALGIVTFFAIMKFSKKVKTHPLCIKLGLINGIVATIVQFLTYTTMDILATFNAVYMYYPIVLCLTIILFSAYSLIVLKERFKLIHILGVTFCALGILLLVIK